MLCNRPGCGREVTPKDPDTRGKQSVYCNSKCCRRIRACECSKAARKAAMIKAGPPSTTTCRYCGAAIPWRRRVCDALACQKQKQQDRQDRYTRWYAEHRILNPKILPKNHDGIIDAGARGMATINRGTEEGFRRYAAANPYWLASLWPGRTVEGVLEEMQKRGLVR